EKGDGKTGFNENSLPYTFMMDRENVVLLNTNHLTGIGFAVEEEPAPQPASQECDDCNTCFVELVHPGNVLLVWFGMILLLGFCFYCWGKGLICKIRVS
ncbi:hypothetical protein MHK_010023, partial [Candidatus Magnetomorum sp. HK-1]